MVTENDCVSHIDIECEKKVLRIQFDAGIISAKQYADELADLVRMAAVNVGAQREDIHGYFGSTYASYLVLPRSVLQSMPDDWQADFVGLVRELESKCLEAGVTWSRSCVKMRDRDGRFIHDPLAEYQRGRRDVFDEER